MSDGFNIRRNVVTTVAAFFVNIALTFIGYRLVVQQGGTAALGLWSALSAAIYVIRLGDVGMGGATERYIAATDASGDPTRARGYLDSALLLNTGLFLALAVLGYLMFASRIGWIVPGDAATHAEALAVLPIMLSGLVLSNLANVVAGGLRGLHLAYQAAYLSVIGGIVQLMVILALVPGLGIAGLAWGQLSQFCVIGFGAWVLFNRQLARQAGTRPMYLPVMGSRQLLAELLGFSLKAQAINFINGLLEPASKLLVGHSAGMSVLGIFEMAYKIVALPRNAVVSGVMGMAPALTRLLNDQPSAAAALYRRSRGLVAAASGGVLLVVVAGSPLISILVLGRMDSLLMTFIAIVALGFWLNATGAPAYALGFAANQTRGNLASAVLSLLLVLGFGGLFRHPWPAYGPVLASAIGLAIGGLFVLWRNQKLLAR